MKKLIVETGSGTAVIPRQRLLELPLPWSHATTATKLHWIFRIAVAMEFVGHGAFGIIGKKAWVPYITVFGFSESTAWQLMPLVGAVDIGLGILTLFRPMPALATLAVFSVLCAMVVAYEAIRHRESRVQLRHPESTTR